MLTILALNSSLKRYNEVTFCEKYFIWSLNNSWLSLRYVVLFLGICLLTFSGKRVRFTEKWISKKLHIWRKQYKKYGKKLCVILRLIVSYSNRLDHIILARLPSNNVQHWEYLVNGGLGISVLKLTEFSIYFS